MSNATMASILSAYATIPARERESTEAWMSRETLRQCMRSVWSVVNPGWEPLHKATLVGMRVMIDDRMADGVISFERRNIATIEMEQ